MKKIYPDILSNSKVDIQFVPLRSRQTDQYISGNYLIRVIIEYGERDRVYFFSHNKQDTFVFRTQKEVIHRDLKAALDEQLHRARKPLDIPQRLHEGYCLQPEIGKPIYGDPLNAPNRRSVYEHEGETKPYFDQNGPSPKNVFPKGEQPRKEFNNNWEQPNNNNRTGYEPQKHGYQPPGNPQPNNGRPQTGQHQGQPQRPNSRQR